MKIILASKNPGKIKEVKAIWKNIDIISLRELTGVPEIIEDSLTFEDNAKKKAFTVFNAYNLPVISDDSGIAVEQLNWLPGVYSARFAGENASDEENNSKLIKELQEFPPPHRAKYVCCAVYFNGSDWLLKTGEIFGTITSQAKGHNGFGYDPYFIPDGYIQTMAELNPEEKNRISHRAIAFTKLKLEMKERSFI